MKSFTTMVESEELKTGFGRKRICILSLSNICNDPRVQRQCEAFFAAGWEVIAMGLGDALASETRWRSVVAHRNPHRVNLLRKIFTRLARIAHLIVIAIDHRWALELYWSSHWTWSHEIKQIYETGRNVRSDVWLANDWNMLPMAARLSNECGGIYAYDTHEYAVAEFPESWRWRLFQRPMVKAVEKMFIDGATIISTVSQGISERLLARYRLAQQPLVVRNVPKYERASFRPTGNAIHVLYHGGLAPYRGLEEIITSVLQWRPQLTLAIRGVGRSHYIQSLHELVENLGVGSRVRFLPPVRMPELVQQAQHFDIGIHALPQTSFNNRFALPNKFFEYVMAGLALCITDSHEMSTLLHRYGLGVVFSAPTSNAIAHAINTLDADMIDSCKRNALMAAQELNWELECQSMLRAYESLVSPASLKDNA